MAHCPRCGEILTPRADGRLRCRTGGMSLSSQLTEEITWFAAGELIELSPSPVPLGGDWHCPADGTRLDPKDDQLYCATCSRTLPVRIWYQVVEFHRHRPAA